MISKNIKKEFITVELEVLKLTEGLYLQKIAVLDFGYHLNPDGSLPKDHYGIYLRVGLDCHNHGVQYITDYSGTTLCSLEDFAKFKETFNA